MANIMPQKNALVMEKCGIEKFLSLELITNG